MKIPTKYPANIHYYFYFQEILPVFYERIFQETDPETRYDELKHLLHDCWAIDLLEMDEPAEDRHHIDDWGLTYARLAATAFRAGKLYNENPLDLVNDFKKLAVDHHIIADSVWTCACFGFKHSDGTDITELLDDFFYKVLDDASDSESHSRKPNSS